MSNDPVAFQLTRIILYCKDNIFFECTKKKCGFFALFYQNNIKSVQKVGGVYFCTKNLLGIIAKNTYLCGVII